MRLLGQLPGNALSRLGGPRSAVPLGRSPTRANAQSWLNVRDLEALPARLVKTDHGKDEHASEKRLRSLLVPKSLRSLLDAAKADVPTAADRAHVWAGVSSMVAIWRPRGRTTRS
jgi:hypothetical protein